MYLIKYKHVPKISIIGSLHSSLDQTGHFRCGNVSYGFFVQAVLPVKQNCMNSAFICYHIICYPGKGQTLVANECWIEQLGRKSKLRIHCKATGTWSRAGLETTGETGRAFSAPGSVIYSQHPALGTLEWLKHLSCLFWSILRAPVWSVWLPGIIF